MFAKLAEKAVEEMKALSDHALEPPDSPADKEGEPRISAGRLWKRAARRMSLCGGAIRNGAKIAAALEQVKGELDGLFQTVAIQGPKELWQVFRLRDILISQYVYLAAMKDYGERNGGRRHGSGAGGGIRGKGGFVYLASRPSAAGGRGVF